MQEENGTRDGRRLERRDYLAIFPKSDCAPSIAEGIVRVFESVASEITSEKHVHGSNSVLKAIACHLRAIGFDVESDKTADGKLRVPVLFGLNGRHEKSFDADAIHRGEKFVLEVEAGRAVANNQFLKDLFQACMMHDVDYLGIAVRKIYRNSSDFKRVVQFFDTMFASHRLRLPLKGILIIGY